MVAYSNKGTDKTKENRGKCVLGLWSEFLDDFMEHDPENEAEHTVHLCSRISHLLPSKYLELNI